MYIIPCDYRNFLLVEIFLVNVVSWRSVASHFIEAEIPKNARIRLINLPEVYQKKTIWDLNMIKKQKKATNKRILIWNEELLKRKPFKERHQFSGPEEFQISSKTFAQLRLKFIALPKLKS